MKLSTKNLTFTSLLLAMGLVLPLLMHLFAAGTVLLPMHIPVLICGFLCGMPYGAICGFALPYISSFLTGMPPMFPTAITMSLELCTYGILAGLFYRKLKWHVYPSLIAAMLFGRAVSGISNAVILGFASRAYSLQIFLTASFITALPGILIQLAFIPLCVLAIEKTKLIDKPLREVGAL